MHFQTIKIHHIDRVSRDGLEHGRWLNLSFRLPDGTPKTWTVPGWPEVQEGMTLTVLLDKPMSRGRADKVLGWKSHSNGELAFFEAGPRHLAYLLLSCFACLGFWWADRQVPSSATRVLAIAFLGVALFSIYTFLRKRYVFRKLRRLPTSF